MFSEKNLGKCIFGDYEKDCLVCGDSDRNSGSNGERERFHDKFAFYMKK